MSFESASRFTNFKHIKGIEHGRIRDQAILTDVLLPDSIASAPGPRPILVNVHGGGLIGGGRDFEAWWAAWVVEWAQRSNAILVAPDYPLAPESQTPEIVAGLKLFWGWLQTGGLQAALDQHASNLGLKADLSRVAVTGESSGAWCSLQLGLAFPRQIRALVLRFGAIDLDDPHYHSAFEVPGMPVAEGVVYDKHVAYMPAGRIVSHGVDAQRMGLIGATTFRGNWIKALGDSDDTFPLRAVEAGGASLPPKVWLFHGEDDPIAPARGSRRAAELIGRHVEGTQVLVDERPGPHGFDTEWHLDHDPIINTRLAWLEEEWLGD